MDGRVVAGRYELGRGGMGTVWLGRDRLVRRQVAVKEIRPPQGLSADERETFGKRALQEATSAAQVRHPNAVIVHDIVPATVDDDAVYLIMEYLPGRNLAQAVHDDGPLPDQRIAEIGRCILSVLEAAHALGIVHRDIKPSNIMIGPDGQVTLADFSIAHTVGQTRLTRSGTMGTGAYMAPELFETRDITPAADLWSLGATLYYATDGKGPFDRESTGATLRAIVLGDIPVPACSPGLTAAINGLLTRDPGQRATIGQTRQRLETAARAAARVGEPPTGGTVPLTRSPAPAVSLAGGPAADAEQWERDLTVHAPRPPAPPPVPTAPPPSSDVPMRRRLLAAGLIGLGVLLTVIGLFLSYVHGLSLADPPYYFTGFYIAEILAWIGAAAWILASRTRPRDGGLFGIALSAAVLSMFIEIVGGVALADGAPGAGMFLVVAGWIPCTAGAALCCRIRPTAAGLMPVDGAPRSGATALRVTAVLAVIGACVFVIPGWIYFIAYGAGYPENSWDLPLSGAVVDIVCDALFILVLLASVILAVRWSGPRDGVPLLAAAAAAAVIDLAEPLLLASTFPTGTAFQYLLTPAFIVFCVFTAGLIASTVWAAWLSRQETVRAGRPAPGVL